MSKLKIVYKPIEELIPYINNSRKHSDSQVAQIASSIKEFGWTNPILLDGKNGIIAGHGRLMAGRLLGETQVPTIELGHLTESQKKAYVIADNKIGMNADWDEELLKIELESLSDVEKALTGFSPDEIKLLLTGWESDIDLTEKDGVNLDGIDTLIKVSVEQESKAFAQEAIANALQQAGINHEFK